MIVQSLPQHRVTRLTLRTCLALLALVHAGSLGTLAAGAQAEGQTAPGEPAAKRPVAPIAPQKASSDGVDLVFAGGSATEYVEAIRSASGLMNVLVASDAALVNVEPLELRRVGVESALYLLDGVRQERDGRFVELRVTTIPSPQPGTMNPVYRLDAMTAPLGKSGEGSRVWSIAMLLEAQLSPEDILTAIETALDLFDEGHAPARMRFHRETGLLIARGHAEQLAAIQSIIDELTGAQSRAQTMRESEGQLARLHSQISESQAAVERLTLELTQSQARNELFEREVDQRDAESRELREQIRRKEERAAELEREMHDLDAKMDQGGAGKPR